MNEIHKTIREDAARLAREIEKRTGDQTLAARTRQQMNQWAELLAGAEVGERFRPLDADAIRRGQK